MDLKDYREMPDSGLYEKIERRVRLRRMARLGGVVAAATVAVVAVVWLLPSSTAVAESASPVEVAAVEVASPTLQQETVAVNEEVIGSTEVAPVAPNVKEEYAVAAPVAVMPTTVAAVEPVAPAAPVAVAPIAVADEVVLTSVEESQPSQVADTVHPAKVGGTEPEAVHYDNVLWAPNVVLPMSDVAENRVFKVQSTSAVSDFRLLIYNRGGRQVFVSSDINRGWDATYNGVTVPQGTYVWVARFRDSDGKLRQEKGTVTVVR